LGAAAGALLYAVLTVTLRANQNVTGLALTTFGAGLANTLGSTAANTNTPQHISDFFSWHPFSLPDPQNPILRFINIAFLSHDLFVYIAIVIAIAMYFFLFRTREGLSIRMVGENPAAADAAGISVTRIKYLYILIGGVLCGLGGLYIPLVLQKTWHADITAGKGWIVVALVIFVRWHPIKAIGGALVFGALSIIGMTIQQFPDLSSMLFFNQYIMVMYPYILTVIVLIITYARKKAWRGPNAIGAAFFREER
jgi:simple sugar transport system permease protein